MNVKGGEGMWCGVFGFGGGVCVYVVDGWSVNGGRWLTGCNRNRRDGERIVEM